MSKLRQILQLLHGGNLSTREIASALHLPKSTVGAIVMASRKAGLDWHTTSGLNDDELN